MSDHNGPLPPYDELLREFNALHAQAEELIRKAEHIKEEMEVVKPRAAIQYEIWFRLPNSPWALWGTSYLGSVAEERLAKLKKECPFREYEIRTANQSRAEDDRRSM